MSPRVSLVYLRPREVVFVRAHHTSMRQASTLAWNQMVDWLERRKLQRSIECGYGLAMEMPDGSSGSHCRYDACVELPCSFEQLVDDEISFQKLPGGPFARVRHVGPYRGLRLSISNVRDEWLPAQPSLQIDRRRPLLVIYLDDPHKRESSKLRSDICLPVRTQYEDAIGRHGHSAAAL